MKKFYSCRYDKTFKEVFLNSKNEDLLESLLEDILKVKIEIKKILPTELITGNNIIKSKRVDALILATNKKIEIEINASINEYVYIRNTAYICNIYSTNALVGDSYNKDIDIIQINLTWGLDYEESKREFRISDKNGNVYVKNLLIMEINMEYYKKIWYSKDEKKIKENELLVMLDLNEGELKKMPKSDKISEKYVESVTILNNDPFFQEYMSHEEDQRKMQNSLIKKAEDSGYKKGIKLGEEKGKEEGLKLGEEKGKEQEKIKMIEKMLNEEIDINTISKVANLPIEKINEIKKIINN